MIEMDRIKEHVPKELREVLVQISEKCKGLGFEAYIVGGAVRDMLLGVELTDIDITVVGDAQRLAQKLSDSLGYRVRLHPFFKTVALDTGYRCSIDITTARREVYTYPGALPEIHPSKLYDDLYRRDFSINAMAVSLEKSGLIDYFGGHRDLHSGLLKVLHSKSFEDDPTRILRGIRLEKRYGFRMDSKTEKLMNASIKEGYPKRLSDERILTELELILTEPQSISMLRRMEEAGLWQILFGNSVILPSTYRKLERIIKGYHNRLLFSALALLEDVQDERLRAVFNRYKACFKKIQAYRSRERCLELPARDRLLENQMLYKLFTETGEEILDYLAITAETEHFKRNIEVYLQEIKNFKFYIDGDVLESLGIAPGPQYKGLLESARMKTVQHSVTDRQGQLKLLKEMVKKGE